MKKCWYIYILECLDGSSYVWMTENPSRRWEQHNFGNGSRYTSEHGAKEIVYMEEYEDLNQARLREHQLKGWSRVKKQKLIRGEWGKWE